MRLLLREELAVMFSARVGKVCRLGGRFPLWHGVMNEGSVGFHPPAWC